MDVRQAAPGRSRATVRRRDPGVHRLPAAAEHLAEQLELGRWSIVEVDGYHLPDTVGRSYHSVHEKTSVAVESIDHGVGDLRYFHGPSFFELSGADYPRGRFGSGVRIRPTSSPHTSSSSASIGSSRAPPRKCRARAVAARKAVGRRPTTNPVERFGERLGVDLQACLAGTSTSYHLYAFSTLRQCGAAWEAASSFLGWLAQFHPSLVGGQEQFGLLAADSKTMLFKLARAATRARPFDPAPDVEVMASRWDAAMEGLSQAPLAAMRVPDVPAIPSGDSSAMLEAISLEEGWEAVGVAPDLADARLLDIDGFSSMRVPGTAGAALRAAGSETGDLDEQDWWFRLRFDAPPIKPETENGASFRRNRDLGRRLAERRADPALGEHARSPRRRRRRAPRGGERACHRRACARAEAPRAPADDRDGARASFAIRASAGSGRRSSVAHPASAEARRRWGPGGQWRSSGGDSVAVDELRLRTTGG